MTVLQIRAEIQNALERVPEKVLPQVLEYLRQIQDQSPEQIKRNNNLTKILSEDRELFERLAK